MKKVLILLSTVFMAGCFVCNKNGVKEKIEEPVEEKVVVEETTAPKYKYPSYHAVPDTANFAFDSKDPILNDGKIDEIVEDWKESPDKIIYVEGHTDNVGPEEYNNKLSFERAKAVANTLIEKGVSEDQIRIQGAGFTKPLVSNDTKEGRAQNRRVDVVLKTDTEK